MQINISNLLSPSYADCKYVISFLFPVKIQEIGRIIETRLSDVKSEFQGTQFSRSRHTSECVHSPRASDFPGAGLLCPGDFALAHSTTTWKNILR